MDLCSYYQHPRQQEQHNSSNMVNRKSRIDWIAITSSCLAASVYLNSLKGEFVYDDSRAILSNQDILPSSTWAVLWTNDFWGTPLTHSASHKSFRPLTTLSFRLNYYFSGFNPWSYHLTNVILHTLTTWLFVRLARLIFRPSSLYQSSEACSRSFCTSSHSPHGSGSNTRQSSPQPSSLSASLLGSGCKSQRRNGAILLSSLLFACHPIHTEAVAGVVGRADVGSTAFALTAFLVYINHVKYRDKYQQCNRSRHHSDDHLKTEHRCPYSNSGNNATRKLNGNILLDQYSGQTSSVSGPIPHHLLYLKSFMYLIASIILATAAMLTKEQGITILLVCATYDLIRSIMRTRRYQEKLSIWNVECGSSVLVLGVSFLLLFHLRLSAMGGYSQTPTFARADNPIPHHPSFWTRLGTFLFLPVFDFVLLLFPYKLSYDWSMESIPRMQKWSDPRILITIPFYFILMRGIVMSLSAILKNSIFSGKSNDYRSENNRNFKHSPIRKSSCSVCCYSSLQAHNRKCSNNNSILYAPIIDELECNGSWSQNMSTICSNTTSNYGSGCRSGLNLFNSQPSHSKFHCRGANASGHLKFNGVNSKLSNNNSYSMYKSRPSSTPSSSSSRSSSADLNVKSNSLSSASLLLQLAFLILPFLPASNLFFYVGFVVAERVLYMPSVGFCLLVGHGFLRLCDRADRSIYGPRVKQLLVAGVFVALVLLSLRTVIRNGDWRDEEKLYRAGIDINPPKSWGNLGNVLSSQGRITEAEVAYRQALRFRSNMADVHYNLGLLLEGQGRFDEALTSYRSAIHFRPRLASAYLSLGQVLTRLGRTAEAMNIYQRCFQLSDDGIKDLRTHIEAKVSALLRFGNLLVEQDDDARSAIKIYREAVSLMPPTYSQAQSVYNAMGEALYRTGEASEAEEWFKEALKKKPDHIPAHLTYGKMLARNKTRLLEAESWFRRAKKIAPADSSVYHHYGQFLSIESRHDEAAEAYVTAAELAPNDYDIIVGAANALRQIGDNIKAEIYYRKAVAIRPEEARAHMNLGAILHVNGKYAEAEDRYLMALRLKPSDDVTLLNLKKLRQLQSRRQSSLSKSSCSSKQSGGSSAPTQTTNGGGEAKGTTKEKTH